MKSATEEVDLRCCATGLGSRGGPSAATTLSPTKLMSDVSRLCPNIGRLLLRGLNSPIARSRKAMAGTLDARLRVPLLYTLGEVASRIPRSRFGVG